MIARGSLSRLKLPRPRALAIAVLLVGLISVDAAASDPEPEIDKYLIPREPRRVALIIGNDDYQNFGDLPGVKADLRKMKETFNTLGFDEVQSVTNMQSWDDFQFNVLKNFRKTIERDDLVVVYFSGHGFTYGGYQYFVPTMMPKAVKDSAIARTAIPIETLPSVFQDEGAGAVLLIFDACRTPADLTIKTADGTMIPKGENNGKTKSPGINYILALAVDKGLPSEASADPNVMSTYSRHLIEHIAQEDDFRRLHDEVEYDVSEETDNVQRPGLYEFTMTDVVVSRGDKWRTLEKELWESVLRDGTVARVKRFAKMHTLNGFVRSARRWLEDHPTDVVSAGVSVPPSAIENAWASNQNIVGVKSPIAFARNETFKHTNIGDVWGVGLPESVVRLGGESSSSIAPTFQELSEIAAQVARQEHVVLGGDATLFREPSIDSERIEVNPGLGVAPTTEAFSELPRMIQKATKVPVQKLEKICTDPLPCFEFPTYETKTVFQQELDPSSVPRSWIKVLAGGDPAWLSLDATNVLFNIDVGSPFKEIIVSPAANAPSGTADLSGLDDALSGIAGSELNWASIAKPPRLSNDTIDDVLSLMEASLSRALEIRGLQRDKITYVEEDPTVPEGKLRLRLFVTKSEEAKQ